MKMKKILKIFAIVAMLIAVFGVMNALAADEIEVYVNDAQIQFDVAPQIINDRTMIPFRYVANAFGAEVDYKEEADGRKIVTAALGDKTLYLTIGDTNAVLIENGKETGLAFDVAPVIVESRTLVPVRLVGEAFGCSVGWNGDERQVIIIDTSSLVDYINSSYPEFYSEVLNLDLTDFAGYYDAEFYTMDNGIENTLPMSFATNDEAVKFTLEYESQNAEFIITGDSVYMRAPSINDKWTKVSMGDIVPDFEVDTADLVIDAKAIIKEIADAQMSAETPTTSTYSIIETYVLMLIGGLDNENGLTITEEGNKKTIDYTVAYALDDIISLRIYKEYDSNILSNLMISLKVATHTNQPTTISEVTLAIEKNTINNFEIVIPTENELITE